jgi:hypothetical protein
MDTLGNIIGAVHLDVMFAKRHAIRNNMLNVLSQYDHKSDIQYEFNSVTVLVANVNAQHRHNSRLNDIVAKYQPMLVFIMEPYIHWNPPPSYYALYSNNLYRNTLWIRNDIRKGKVISRINYGFAVDNIAFRYIPPNTKQQKISLYDIEVGDWNFLSNKWLKVNRSINCENRKNKPGGVCVITNFYTKCTLHDINSDHAAIFAEIQTQIKPKLKTDYWKLNKALEKGVAGIVDKDIYTYDRRWKADRQLIIKENDKIVNPIARNLDLQPYYDLYKHQSTKAIPEWYAPTISEPKSKVIQSKAEDINQIPIRSMIKLTEKLNVEQKNTLMKSFGWTKFETRTICLKKKDKEPNKVTNLRPIQISPWNFKIAEQSRQKLKEWLDSNTDKRCYAFKKNSKIEDIVNWIKGRIKQ